MTRRIVVTGATGRSSSGLPAASDAETPPGDGAIGVAQVASAVASIAVGAALAVSCGSAAPAHLERAPWRAPVRATARACTEGEPVASLPGLCLTDALRPVVRRSIEHCEHGSSMACTHVALVYDVAARDAADPEVLRASWQRACDAGRRAACVRAAELDGPDADRVLFDACQHDPIACYLSSRRAMGGDTALEQLADACLLAHGLDELADEDGEPDCPRSDADCERCVLLARDARHMDEAQFLDALTERFYESRCNDARPFGCEALAHIGIRRLLLAAWPWEYDVARAELSPACRGAPSTYSCDERSDACTDELIDVRCQAYEGDGDACALRGLVVEPTRPGAAMGMYEIGCMIFNESPIACTHLERMQALERREALAECLEQGDVRSCRTALESEEIRDEHAGEITEVCRRACDGRRHVPGCQCLCELDEPYFVAQLAPEDRGFEDTEGGRGWGNRCYAHLGAGRLQQAQAACEAGLAAAEQDRVRGAILYNLGRIAEARGERREAIERYEDSLDVRPGNAIVEERLRRLRDEEDW